MYKPQIRLTPTACEPSTHSAQMAINAIPHYFANETTNLLEAIDSIELGHSQRGIVAMPLVDQPASSRMYDFPLQVAIRGSAFIRSIKISK